jgi:hypothetical protein
LSIHDTISKRIITHHIIQKHEAIPASRLGYLFNKHLARSFVGCRICALGQEIIQDVLGLPNLTGLCFHPVHRINMKFSKKIAEYYFMIAQMSLILLQLEFGLNGVLQE